MLGTFVVWMFFNSYVKASVLFTTLALFEVLRASVGLLMPWGIRFFAEAIAATKRIEVGSRFGIPISDNFKSIACRFTVILFQSSIPIQKVKKSTEHFSIATTKYEIPFMKDLKGPSVENSQT